jgi:hypothetical protein
MKALKTKSLPVWIQLLSRLGINSAKNALEKRLPDGSPEEQLVLGVAEPMLGTVNVLSDDDVDNPMQVRALWLKWLNSFMTPWAFNLFQPVVDGIEKTYNRAMVQYLKSFAENTALILTDEIKPNKDQINAYVKAELAKEETQTLFVEEFIGGNLEGKVPAELKDFVVEALNIGWDAFVGRPASDQVRVTEIDGHLVYVMPSGRKIQILD